MKRSPSRARSVHCVVCTTSFVTRHSQGKYCSPVCAREGERKSWREYGYRNAEPRRQYHRRLYENNVEKIAARILAYKRTPAGKRAERVNSARQREKFPEKYAARQAVLIALRSGRLQRQPCKRCGAAKAQAHHHDYSKLLDVEWLCGCCHRIEHRHQRQTERIAA